jgi:hypothetical protein
MEQPHTDMESIVSYQRNPGSWRAGTFYQMLSEGSDVTDPVLTTLSTWNTALKILPSCTKSLTCLLLLKDGA